MTWDRDMDPETYLRRWPEGQYADDAREAIAERDDDEFETGVWNGRVLYHCPMCPYSTVDRDQMNGHVNGH